MNSLRPIIAVLAALASFPAQAQEGSSLEEIHRLLEPYASIDDAVTLPDGRVAHFTCMGEGAPTVILIPGMGVNAAVSWARVQPEMAKMTRACAWDRPGWGLSDGAEGKHTVATSTATLEAALATGEISGPYVMVGHSLGGYESLLYADRHPDRVVGMVLVDPSIPDQTARSRAVGMGVPDPAADPYAVFRTCAAAIREGRAKLGGPDPDGCFAYPPIFPPALVEAYGEKVSNPVQYETMFSFLSSFDEDAEIVINPARDYGDMPLVVLTATANPPPAPQTTPEQVVALEAWVEEWNRAHDELAALSSRGVNARVPGANHNIQGTKPQVVIDAVDAVVAEARAGMRQARR